jgi:phage gp36-like protein
MPLVPSAGTLYYYATPTDLQNVGGTPAFVQSLTAAQMQEAIQNASALIDAYLGSYLVLPLIQIDPSITQKCCEIAIWYLITARGYNPQKTAEAMFEKRFEQALAFLKDCANNKARPAGVKDSSPSAQPGAAALPAGPQTVNPQTGTTPTGPTTWGTWARR